jgi:hypothetical protein
MASPQTALNRELQDVLSTMAGGSQDDLATVASVSLRLWHALRAPQYRQNTEKLRPSLRLLLQAAGWLYPGFMPSSSLHPDVQAVVQQAWTSCMHLAHSILSHDSLDHMPAVLSLVQPHDRPQVPGELHLSLPRLWILSVQNTMLLDHIDSCTAECMHPACCQYGWLLACHSCCGSSCFHNNTNSSTCAVGLRSTSANLANKPILLVPAPLSSSDCSLSSHVWAHSPTSPLQCHNPQEPWTGWATWLAS